MPFFILFALAANLSLLQVGGDTALSFAKFSVLFAIAFLGTRFGREGLLGAELQRLVVEAPIWKILASGVAVFVIEGIAANFANATLSHVIRGTLGPIGFGIVFAAAEIAIHRRRLKGGRTPTTSN